MATPVCLVCASEAVTAVVVVVVVVTVSRRFLTDNMHVSDFIYVINEASACADVIDLTLFHCAMALATATCLCCSVYRDT